MSWFDDQKRFDDADVIPAGAMPVLFGDGCSSHPWAGWRIQSPRCGWYGCAFCDPQEAREEAERLADDW